MTQAEEVRAKLERAGRIALVELVRSPSLEARLAFPRLLENVLGQAGGRLAWAGSIDSLLIGAEDSRFGDVVVSEFPNGATCLRALALRSEWQPLTIVDEIASYAARPWSGFARSAAWLAFSGLGLRGGGPPVFEGHGPAAAAALADELGVDAPTAIHPGRAELETLATSEADGPVVMLNFLDYREVARYDDADPAEAEISGARAYRAYGAVAMGLIGRLGGRIRWRGEGVRLVSSVDPARDGKRERTWREIVAVQYPSRRAFLGMLRAPAYREASRHRDAGLARTKLLACTSHADFH